MQVGGFAFRRNPQEIINIHRGISRGGALPHKLAYDEPKRHLPQDDLGNGPTPAGGQHLAFGEGAAPSMGENIDFYPGRLSGACSLVCLHCQRPSPCNSKVGSCNCFFGACSAFTHVTACTLAESPSDPLHRELRQLRCLRCRLDCFRVERTSSRAGVAPAEVQRLSRRTVTPTIANVSTLPVSGRGEILKQLNLQQKHEISGLHIWGSDTHISHPSDVSYGRICCICICRPHGQPSVGTQ